MRHQPWGIVVAIVVGALLLGACRGVAGTAVPPIPIPTVTKTPTPVPTVTKTPTPVPTATKTPTPVPTATAGATPTPTAAADLVVQKTAQCSSPYTCLFTITVTNLGPGSYAGSLTVVDQTTPSWSTLLSGGGSISGASCSGPSPNVVCQAASVALASGQSYNFSFGVYFGPSGSSQPFQNCASLPPGTDGNPANNQACIPVSPPGPTPSPTPTPLSACVVSSVGLIAWWRMEDPVGSSSLSDALGSHSGLLKSSAGAGISIGPASFAPPPTVETIGGLVSSGLRFNEAYAAIPPSSALNIGPNGMTWAGWLNTPPGVTPQPLLDKGDGVSPGSQIIRGYTLFMEWNASASAHDLIFRLGNGVGSPGAYRVTAPGVIPANQFVFVAVTVAWLSGNQADVRLYVNGNLVQTGTITGVNPTNVASPADLWLAGYHNYHASGAEPQGPVSAEMLVMDEWEIWGRVLSPSEIQTIYATEAGGQPKCTP